MMSIPRDTVNAPLPDGAGYYQPKLNSLLGYATRNPGAFPGRKPIRVLKDTIAGMVGIPIDYYASVDLPGFIKVVDAIGGIGVYVKEPLWDYRYREYGFNGFGIDAGCHHLDGQIGARVRADPLLRRAERLHARRPPAAGPRRGARPARPQGAPPGRPRAVRRARRRRSGRTCRAALLPRLAELATEIDARDVTQAVVQPPLVSYGQNGYGSVLIPDLAAIRTVADGLFSATGTEPVGWPPVAPTPTPDPGEGEGPEAHAAGLQVGGRSPGPGDPPGDRRAGTRTGCVREPGAASGPPRRTRRGSSAPGARPSGRCPRPPSPSASTRGSACRRATT